MTACLMKSPNDFRVARGHILAVIVGAMLLLPSLKANAEEMVTVATTAIVDHPALEATRDGVPQVLNEAGYVEGKNLIFVYESAQGNMATASQIARGFVGDNPTVIVPISTPSAQAVLAATKTIPVVFSTVTDPVAAKIVPQNEKPGGNVTGVQDFPPLKAHIDLIRQFVPEASKIGVIFNPGEANSIVQIDLLRIILADAGIEMVEAPATKSSDVLAAMRGLVGSADVIYSPNDNTAVTTISSIIKVGVEHQLPVFAGETAPSKTGPLPPVGSTIRTLDGRLARLSFRL